MQCMLVPANAPLSPALRCKLAAGLEVCLILPPGKGVGPEEPLVPPEDGAQASHLAPSTQLGNLAPCQQLLLELRHHLRTPQYAMGRHGRQPVGPEAETENEVSCRSQFLPLWLQPAGHLPLPLHVPGDHAPLIRLGRACLSQICIMPTPSSQTEAVEGSPKKLARPNLPNRCDQR